MTMNKINYNRAMCNIYYSIFGCLLNGFLYVVVFVANCVLIITFLKYCSAMLVQFFKMDY